MMRFNLRGGRLCMENKCFALRIGQLDCARELVELPREFAGAFSSSGRSRSFRLNGLH